MVNFLDETIEVLQDFYGENFRGKVDYVYIDVRSSTFEEFEKWADFEYDNGYGHVAINLSMCIVMTDNSWLSRDEYDGSESWIYNKKPDRAECEIDFENEGIENYYRMMSNSMIKGDKQ